MKEEDRHTVQHEGEVSGVWKEGDPAERAKDKRERGRTCCRIGIHSLMH